MARKKDDIQKRKQKIHAPPSEPVEAALAEVTARVFAEESTRQAYERLALAQRAAGAGVWDWDMTTEKLNWAPELFRLFGLDPATAVGSFETWRGVVHPEDREAAEERIRTAVRDHVRLENEYRIVLPSGEVRWISALGDTTYDANGRPLRMAGICLDFTERKLAEEKIRVLARFPSENPDPVLRIDRDGTLLYVNKAGLGKLPEWHLQAGQSAPSMLHDVVSEAMNSGSTQLLDLKQGKRTFSFSVTPIADAGYANLYGRDITERKLAEEALRESEERFQQLFDNMADGVAVYQGVDEGQDFVFVPMNRTGQSLSKVRLDEAVGRRVTEVFPAVERIGLLDVFRRVWETGRPEHHPVTAYKDRRIEQWVENYVYKLPSGLIVAIYSDTSEKHRAEEALRESEEKYRLLVENQTDLVVKVDNEGRFLFVSPSYCEMFAKRQDELLGQTFMPLVHPDDQAGTAEAMRALYAPPHRAYVEQRAMTRHGWRWFGWLDTAVLDQYGQVIETVGVGRDITSRKRAEKEREKLEAQLLQAQKMESVGRLAGGVAHDFNNMLSVILGHTEMALDQVDPAQPLHADLQEILTAARRSRDITRQLLAFARKQTVAPKVLDLNETVEGMLKMMRQLIGEDIDLAWRPKAGLWPVKMDPSQIDQILVNLCVNARDAIALPAPPAYASHADRQSDPSAVPGTAEAGAPRQAGGVGKVTIETDKVTFDEAYCADHAGFVPGEFALLAVSDSGCGMDKEILDNIFEPFFTTKGMGRGTGLGLATVYGIVKQNDGFINVYSEPGKGTTIKIYLPRHAGEAEEIRAEGAEEILKGRGETMLLVEDDSAIMKMGKMMLKKLGYQVLAASTAGEAMSLAEEHAGGIHLLITDVVMPEMNGRDLAERLHTLYPDLKVLFMSGYTANVIAHQGVLDKGVHFMQKPFSMQDLARKVREALEP